MKQYRVTAWPTEARNADDTPEFSYTFDARNMKAAMVEATSYVSIDDDLCEISVEEIDP